MIDREQEPKPWASAGLAARSDPEFGASLQELRHVLQDLVLEDLEVKEFLAYLATRAAAMLSTASNTVSCGITVLTRKRGIAAASSDEKGRTLDELQNGLNEGPCLTALLENSVVFVPDTGRENRWPESMEAVRKAGIGSILSVPLDVDGEAEAVMNLYSSSPRGFSGTDRRAAEDFAETAAKSLRLTLKIAGLRQNREDLATAMESRSTIDTAIGILMAQNRCGRDAAFKMLTRASNNRNVKLRDIAAQIIASVSGETDTAPHFDD